MFCYSCVCALVKLVGVGVVGCSLAVGLVRCTSVLRFGGMLILLFVLCGCFCLDLMVVLGCLFAVWFTSAAF